MSEASARRAAETRARIKTAPVVRAQGFDPLTTNRRREPLGGDLYRDTVADKGNLHERDATGRKAWNLCRRFQCMRPTESGEREKDLEKRFCRYHAPVAVATRTEELARGRGKEKRTDLRARGRASPKVKDPKKTLTVAVLRVDAERGLLFLSCGHPRSSSGRWGSHIRCHTCSSPEEVIEHPPSTLLTEPAQVLVARDEKSERLRTKAQVQERIGRMKAISPPLPEGYRKRETIDGGGRRRIYVGEDVPHFKSCRCPRCEADKDAREGPMRRIVRAVRAPEGFTRPSVVLLSCGHEGQGWPRSIRVRCSTCKGKRVSERTAPEEVKWSRSGPLRRIVRILKRQPSPTQHAVVELECGHEGKGWGSSLRARCRTCTETVFRPKPPSLAQRREEVRRRKERLEAEKGEAILQEKRRIERDKPHPKACSCRLCLRFDPFDQAAERFDQAAERFDQDDGDESISTFNKPWDLCRRFMCRNPTTSGTSERDPAKRTCAKHARKVEP